MAGPAWKHSTVETRTFFCKRWHETLTICAMRQACFEANTSCMTGFALQHRHRLLCAQLTGNRIAAAAGLAA